MASFFLSWNPHGNQDQTIQYKAHTDVSWDDYVTISFVTDSYLIEGLDVNTLYDFRIESECDDDPVYSNEKTAISFTCPSVTASTTDNVISYSFPTSTSDISVYRVLLIKDGNIVTYEDYTSPFDNPIEGTFSVAVSDGSYKVQVMTISGDDGEFNKTCPESSSLVPPCIDIDGISGSISQ